VRFFPRCARLGSVGQTRSPLQCPETSRFFDRLCSSPYPCAKALRMCFGVEALSSWAFLPDYGARPFRFALASATVLLRSGVLGGVHSWF
jgi:hypothetical protein